MTRELHLRIDVAQDGRHPWCARLMASSEPWVTLSE
jgi:hypothetical protein